MGEESTTPTPADVQATVAVSAAPDADTTTDTDDSPDPKVTRANKEAAKYRTELRATQAAQKAQADAVARALGLTGDDTPDPAQLAAALAEQRHTTESLAAVNRAQRVELAAWKASAALDVNPAGLLDSRAFMDTVSKLNPDDEDFTKQLSAAVKKAAESNPLLRQTRAVAQAGGEFPGRPGVDARPTDLEGALLNRLSRGA